MTDLHIDDFYKDCGLILLRLYNHFPRKTILYVDDICGSDAPDEFGLPSDRYLAGFSAMLWLADENYLRYSDTIQQQALDQAVLTEKTLVLLSRASSGGAESQLLQLRDCLRSGSSERISAFMATFFANAASYPAAT